MRDVPEITYILQGALLSTVSSHNMIMDGLRIASPSPAGKGKLAAGLILCFNSECQWWSGFNIQESNEWKMKSSIFVTEKMMCVIIFMDGLRIASPSPPGKVKLAAGLSIVCPNSECQWWFNRQEWKMKSSIFLPKNGVAFFACYLNMKTLEKYAN